MRRSIMAGVIAGAALAAGSATAMAQVVIETAPPADVYVATPQSREVHTYTYTETVRPRTYGYTRYYDTDDDDVVVVRRRHRGGCGAAYYWDGARCIGF